MNNSQFDSNTIGSSKSDGLRLLHLIWESPDQVIGGMGVAGGNLCEALGKNDGVMVKVISPSSEIDAGLTDVNSYQLEIDMESVLNLQKFAESQLGLYDGCAGGVVVDFAKLVHQHQLVDEDTMQCSVVHAHDWMTAAAGVIVQRSLGVPLILHVHSTQIDREGAHAKGALYQHEKWAMQQADIVIAVSDYTRHLITDHYGIYPSKIRVVRNASAMNGGDPALDEIDREPVVIFVGRLVTQKCPEIAVEIMVGALKKLSNARGVIVGGGDKLRVIRELIKFKGMDDRIEVLGNMPQKNMQAVYNTASVLIMPSISEPFGIVAIEAASAGVAVIMSDRCGASEVLNSAQVIELYEVDEWIGNVVSLLENSERREAQVRQQRIDIEGYDWNAAGNKVLKIVNELSTIKESK